MSAIVCQDCGARYPVGLRIVCTEARVIVRCIDEAGCEFRNAERSVKASDAVLVLTRMPADVLMFAAVRDGMHVPLSFMPVGAR